MSKIVCIGWSKTGTGSVGYMLRTLYGRSRTTQRPPKTTGKDLPPLHPRFIPDRFIPILKNHTAFHDFPWAYWFPLIDKLYPDSKFIYTHRKDPQTWLASCKAYYKETNPTSEYLYNGYGMPDTPVREAVWIKRYIQHDEFVNAYFSRDDSNLLRINIDAGELSWIRVCGFLGKPVPRRKVPHLNKREEYV